mgnify:CR=1 FL=1
MSINLTYYGTKKQVTTLAMGVFDGVHQGHQALLNKCTGLLTFDPHPITLTQNVTQLKRLTTLPEMAYYIDTVIALTFNTHIQTMSATTFLSDIILKHINPQHIVIGYDYHFGKNRQGTPDFLHQWGQQNNIDVTIVQPIKHQQTIVKSRNIRALLLANNFNQAITQLGHPYLMLGKVIKGESRGKTLGFPTANLQFPTNKLIPHNGVYIGHTTINNKTYKTMIYIGQRPTFANQSHAVEAFILNYSGNLYNQTLPVYITQFLRPEIKFTNKTDLINQINKDINHANNN